ncbi:MULTISPECIES: OmpA family protein [Nguyenibacter]|uniref:OmpA family protein n=1 Tax=Nguyenibacter vanlangensis TaxID=1216886 RepID=A0A7Y7IY15_9PROT|nr:MULTISPECIES: OmpA family protein [Nguyenibacter]NVN12410.1 OmpA family protein [Nguyenibacter vanlangensis]WRH88059.1 OmpA family protein [Nguyenibacter sp. L1]
MRRLSLILGLCLLAGCTNGPSRKFVVFFTRDSSRLDDPARWVVTHAAQQAALYPQASVSVEGYAAAHGDLSADALLAVDRAKKVADQLVADGVAPSRIRQTPRPPSNEDGAVGARRVEIEIGAS